jgi:nucleoside-diphosphate-sugar epimerase
VLFRSPTGAARIGESFDTIGWTPRIGLEEGLARTIDFYRKERAN